jgi:O-antigen/teichoic acid export membrane protein
MGPVLVRNVVSNVLSRGLSIIAWLALTPWVLRALGPERFGFWSLLSALATTALVLDLGLGSAITKFVAAYGDASQADLQRSAFTTGALIASALAVAWGAGGWFARGLLLQFAHVGTAWHAEALAAAGTMVYAAALGLLALVPSAALTGVHRLDLVNRIAVVSTLVQVSASIAALYRGSGLGGLMLALLLGSATSFIASVVVLRRVAPQLRLDLRAASGAAVREQLVFSAGLQVISLGVLFQFQLPKFALARWVGLSAVGEYELAYRVAFAAWTLPSLLLPPLLPALSELAAQGHWERVWSLYRRAARYLLAVALPLVALMASLSRALYRAWLGPGHAPAALALTAIASLLGINVLTSTGCLLGRAIGRPWMEASYHLVSLLLHLGLAAWLVPRFGLNGALLAMFISGTVGTIQFVWVFHRRLRQSLPDFARRIVAMPALVSLAGAIVAWAVCGAIASPGTESDRARALLGLVAGGACGAAVLALGILRLGYVTRDDLRDVLHRLPGARRPV